MIAQINAIEPSFLPGGLKLGFEIVDSCGTASGGLAQIVRWCNERRMNSTDVPMALVIGTSYSRVSIAVAPVLSNFGIPMVDYGATTPTLSDRARFPLFTRVTASDGYMAKAMVDTVENLGWKCVHLVYSHGGYGTEGGEEVAQSLINKDICIADRPYEAPLKLEGNEGVFDNIVARIDRSNAIRPIICFCEEETLLGMLQSLAKFQKEREHSYFLLAGDFWGKNLNILQTTENLGKVALNSITYQTVSQTGVSLTDDDRSIYDWLKEDQDPVVTDPWVMSGIEHSVNHCTWKSHPFMQKCTIHDINANNIPHSDWLPKINNAVLASAYGLREFLLNKCGEKAEKSCYKFDIVQDGSTLYSFIRNATFSLEDGGNFSFYASGDGFPRYEINRMVRGGRYETVGFWDNEAKLSLSSDGILQPNAYKDSNLPNTCPPTNSTCEFSLVPGRIVAGSAVEKGGICLLKDEAQANTVELLGPCLPQFWAPLALSALALLLLLLVAFIVLLFCFLKNSKAEVKADETDGKIEEEQVESSETDQFYALMRAENITDSTREQLHNLLSKAQIPSAQIRVSNIVAGQGEYAVVYKGEFRQKAGPNRVVAVKTIRSETPKEIIEFLNEGSVMCQFDHPNIIKLLGVNINNGTVRMVFPFMNDGNLKNFLRTKKSEQLGQQEMICFTMQICCAMEYLANKGVVHRDLACRNILIEVLPYISILKLSDFGLSRQLHQSDYYRPLSSSKQRPIPIRWYPPESIVAQGMFEERSDVWSFGIVCYEIFSYGATPYKECNSSEVKDLVVRKRRFPEQPSACSDCFYNSIMVPCWAYERLQRPRFHDLMTHLETIRKILSNATKSSDLPNAIRNSDYTEQL